MKKETFLVALLTLLFSGCSQEKSKDELTDAYQWVLRDSIQVDYMGELFLMDYDPLHELYLGRWNAQEEYVVFDESGKIKHIFKLTEDGPNSIAWAQGVNFLDGKICVMDESQGIQMARYQDWYEAHRNVIFGRIEQIYRRESDVVVIYTKGVSEAISSQYSRDNREE